MKGWVAGDSGSIRANRPGYTEKKMVSCPGGTPGEPTTFATVSHRSHWPLCLLPQVLEPFLPQQSGSFLKKRSQILASSSPTTSHRPENSVPTRPSGAATARATCLLASPAGCRAGLYLHRANRRGPTPGRLRLLLSLPQLCPRGWLLPLLPSKSSSDIPTQKGLPRSPV